MRIEKIVSEFDGLELEVAIAAPAGAPRAVVQFSHGMAEHKERYFDFMRFLADRGYACVIHDHRGHGESVREKNDYGFFYTEDARAIVEDLHAVTRFAKDRFPGAPLCLFGHSMGSLVARCYLKRYDAEIDKLVLCGPPTHNPAARFGLAVAQLVRPLFGAKAPNKLLNALAFAGFNAGNETPNGWLSANPQNVERYNQNPRCGFVFTTNGFINLFKLQVEAFDTEGWRVGNPDLPILVIAGADDPVIRSEKHFRELVAFLGERGYTNVASKLYPGMRHEILNEVEHMTVYEDVLRFLE